jgi:hypothetical protein
MSFTHQVFENGFEGYSYFSIIKVVIDLGSTWKIYSRMIQLTWSKSELNACKIHLSRIHQVISANGKSENVRDNLFRLDYAKSPAIQPDLFMLID